MRHALAGAVVALALSSPVVARAQKSDDLARAESLFNAAKALLDGGQNAEACAKFAQSKRLAPGLGVTLFLADCYERIGRFASAWTEFRSAEGLARDRNDKRADVARERAQALEPRLSRLVVTVSPTVPQAGLQLLLDGASLSPEEWGLPTAVDPGNHVVLVTSQGRTRRTITTHLGPENPRATVEVDGLDEPAPKGQAPALSPGSEAVAPPVPAPPEPDQPSSRSDPGATRRWIGIGTGGAGVVSLVVSGALGLAAKGKFNQSNATGEGCSASPDQCLPGSAGASLRKDAVGTADVATVFVIAGAVAVAAGVVLYVTAPHGSPTASALFIAPTSVPGGGGALLSGTF